MSRPKISAGIEGVSFAAGPRLAGAKILGSVTPPEPVSVIVAGPDGKQNIFPATVVHMFSDAAIGMLANLVGNVVEQVLARHGLITLPEPPAAAAEPEAKSA